MNAQKLKEKTANLINICINLNAKVRATSNRYILCLHRVMTEEEASQQSIHHSMWISPKTFDGLLHWANSVGKIVSLDEIMDFSTPNNETLFCLTFDDGWLDNYTLAFPIIKKHKAPTTIFIVTDAITTGDLFWADELVEKAAHLFHAPNSTISAWIKEHIDTVAKQNLATDKDLMNNVIEALKTLSDSARTAALTSLYKTNAIDPKPIKGKLMSWDQVKELAEAGISFQSHTHTHKILVNIDDATTRFELKESKRVIEESLGGPCNHFCYPNARFDSNKTFLVGEAGYRFGFKIDNEAVTKTSDQYLIPRMLVCENYVRNINYFKLKLLGLPIYNRK